jgi:hypothetical protein
LTSNGISSHCGSNLVIIKIARKFPKVLEIKFKNDEKYTSKRNPNKD